MTRATSHGRTTYGFLHTFSERRRVHLASHELQLATQGRKPSRAPPSKKLRLLRSPACAGEIRDGLGGLSGTERSQESVSRLWHVCRLVSILAMQPPSPLPYFAWMVLYVLLAGEIARRWPFFARERGATVGGYNVPIEGLRGILALSVFLYHVALTQVYFQTGQLGDVTRFFEHCGSSAVLLFFFVTGFLFWSKALRVGPPRALPFLGARAWRIFPAYFLSVALVVLVTAARSDFRLKESAPHVAGEVVRWCAFGFLGFPDVNAIPNTILVNAGVFWTLKWEWVFYLVLPWLGWFAHGRRVFLLAGLLACEYGLSVATGRHGGMAQIFSTGFYPGMLSAHLVRSKLGVRLAQLPLSGAIPVACLAAAVMLPPKSLLAIPLLWIAFTAIAAGNDVFGLLRRSGLVVLGRISYSTYVLHGAVLFVGSRLLNRLVPIAGMSPFVFWACLGFVGVVVVVVSAVSFQFVEHPFFAGFAHSPIDLHPSMSQEPVELFASGRREFADGAHGHCTALWIATQQWLAKKRLIGPSRVTHASSRRDGF